MNVYFGQVLSISKGADPDERTVRLQLHHGPNRGRDMDFVASALAMEHVHVKADIAVIVGYDSGLFRCAGDDTVTLMPSQSELNNITSKYGVMLSQHEYAVCLSAVGARRFSDAAAAIKQNPKETKKALHAAIKTELGPHADTAVKFLKLLDRKGEGEFSLVRDLFIEAGILPKVDDSLIWQAVSRLSRRADWRGMSIADLLEEFPWVLAQCWSDDRERAELLANKLAEYLAQKRPKTMICSPRVGMAASAAITYLLRQRDHGHAFAWKPDLKGRMLATKASEGEVDHAWTLLREHGQLFGGIKEYGEYSAEIAAELGESSRLKLKYKREDGREYPNGVYLPAIYWAEHWAAKTLAEIVYAPDSVSLPGNLAEIANAESLRRTGHALDRSQMRFIGAVVDARIVTLTGEAGTGKTAALKALVWALEVIFPERPPAVIAPTATAARRTASDTYALPDTAHRFSGLWANSDTDDAVDISVIARVLRDYDIILVDEGSMLTIPLLRKILDASSNGAKFIIAGDPYQLPAIGAGGAFVDLIRLADADTLGLIVHVDLKENHRSGEAVIEVARAVRRGDRLFEAEHVRVIPVRDEDGAVAECVKTVLGIIGGPEDNPVFDPNTIMVLSPVRGQLTSD